MFSLTPIQYDAPIYRPPSEWNSLLIQVTIGCSNNKCTYCDMYRSKKYRVRSFEEIQTDLIMAAKYYKQVGIIPEKIFFCDGDALGAPIELLVKCLDLVQTLFPNSKRVGIYATAQNILDKTPEELQLLNQKKLAIAYLGLESGDDQILHMIVKGNTAEQMLTASLKIKEAGFKLSSIVMLGVGGKKYSEQHVRNSAKMISATCPDYLSFLTTFAVPNTPYHRMVERGNIEPLTSKELLIEMRDILADCEVNNANILFRANHVSNAKPIGGSLPSDKQQLIDVIDEWIANTPEGAYPPTPSSM